MNSSARNAALAKYANNGWLPWWMHGRDTAGIMVLLVDNWLSKAAVHETGIDLVILKKTAAFLGYLHDMGKLISIFQCLITETLPDFRQILNENKLESSPLATLCANVPRVCGDDPSGGAGGRCP